MARFQNPGAFFMCTLDASEQKFLKPLLENAKNNGYTRIVEPCAGAFAMSHIAAQAGYKGSQIESSDVAMFTSIMGYAIMGKSLEELELRAEGFSDKELLDPATALFAQLYLRTAKQAGKDYFFNLLMDLENRRSEHIQSIQKQLDRAKQTLQGMNYRALDMWEHLDECADDEHTLILANPPTYTAGFEKWYDTGGKMTWKEPQYGIFDASTGIQDLYNRYNGANALFLVYEENEPGKTSGHPIFARYGVRDGVNTYITSNRAEEATALAHGKKIKRPNESILEPLNCSTFPRDSEITKESKVQVQIIDRVNAQYYRKLWTHNFVGSSAPINVGVLIDGMIAGVFGIDKAALTMGAFGTRVSDAIFLMYGMTVPHQKYRLNRLLTMLAQNRPFIESLCNDLEREKVNHLKTVQMTKYPEAKEMRGVMKLTKKVPDPKMGFRLTYESELKNRNEQETLIEWLAKEEKWRKERQKAKAQQ